MRCHGSHEKSQFPEGGNAECCCLAKDWPRRVQGALGFGNSMKVISDTGDQAQQSWAGDHQRSESRGHDYK